MDFEFRIRTGFFETMVYDLLISKGKLVLSPKESGDSLITIPEKSEGSPLNRKIFYAHSKFYLCRLNLYHDFFRFVDKILFIHVFCSLLSLVLPFMFYRFTVV